MYPISRQTHMFNFCSHFQCGDSHEWGLPHTRTQTTNIPEIYELPSPRSCWPLIFSTCLASAASDSMCLAKAPVRIEQLKGHRADLCRKAMGKTIQTFLGTGAVKTSFMSSSQATSHMTVSRQPTTTFLISEKSETFMCPNMGYIMVYHGISSKSIQMAISFTRKSSGSRDPTKTWMTMTS